LLTRIFIQLKLDNAQQSYCLTHYMNMQNIYKRCHCNWLYRVEKCFWLYLQDDSLCYCRFPSSFDNENNIIRLT